VQAATPAPTAKNNDRPSIVIVEFVGFGGDSDNGTPAQPKDDKQHRTDIDQGYDRRSAVQVVGYGPLTDRESYSLTDEEKRNLSR
jgi:hypothetical protein